MHYPRDASSAQDRYGLVLVESPRSPIVEETPWRPPIGIRAWAASDPRARAERLAVAGFALTYLAAFGWLALRAVRWVIEG